jgi:DegV family protein with EDD domain
MITVVTDSICAPSVGKLNTLGIMLIPINLHIGGNVYLDIIEIQQNDFYRQLASARELPTTSAPSVERYRESFQKVLDEGRTVLCFTVTSALSNTYNSAVQAREKFPDKKAEKIHIIDTEAAGAAASLLVVEAAKMAQEGLPLEIIVSKIAALIPNTKLLVMIDTLDLLQKSGRVGKLAAMAGELFKVKPIIYLQRGSPQFSGRARGRRQALKMIVDEFIRDTTGANQLRLAVTHADAEEEGLALLRELEIILPGAEIDIVPFTPAMGAHTGPGVLGIGYTFI